MNSPRWIIEQRWNHVLFLHWRIDPSVLQPLVPFDLDLFHGEAVISIVPFRMEGIRLPYTPPLFWVPGLTCLTGLWELNLRTYVTVGNRTGVYFFTLDTDSRIGSWIANRFFHLPYRLAGIEGEVSGESYRLNSQRPPFSFSVEAGLDATGKKKVKTELDHWATERYRLFTKDRHHTYEGMVMHGEWPLEEVKLVTLEDRFSCQLPISLRGDPESLSYVRSLVVRFCPFRIVR